MLVERLRPAGIGRRLAAWLAGAENAGRFAGHTDMVGKLPVSYYVHPGREADGARSFGKTPKMLKFFGERLSYPYPYAKYAQIAVSDESVDLRWWPVDGLPEGSDEALAYLVDRAAHTSLE